MNEVLSKEPTLSLPLTVKDIENTRINTVDFDNIPFGRVFSDHMMHCDYANGKWGNIQIEPYGNFSLSPACSALHYGQAIFEGMKAYYTVDGEVALFRPQLNAARFNRSAVRMSMPEFPENDFVETIRYLVAKDRQWVPKDANKSLYIRPYMFGNDAYIGVRTSEHYKIVIFTCPVGAYYSAPVTVTTASKYVRAFNGGTGFTKCAGNYAATLYPAKLEKEKGYDQIMWTDGLEHKYIHEIGTMNVFFIIDRVALTAPLDGNILPGVTRDSIITLLKDEGIEVQERPITIDEVMAAGREGRLTDAFGTGTAASVSFIRLLHHEGEEVEVPVDGQHIATKMKDRLNNIKTGREEDKFGWIVKV